MEHFRLKNLVYPADRTVIVTAFCSDTSLLKNIEAGYISGNGCHQDGSMPDSLRKFEPIPFDVCGNILEFKLFLAGEGWHSIKLRYSVDGESTYGYLEFYTLYDDLFKLMPYKGNFHCHTTDSDGLNTPQNALCVAREAGFDFTAFSEHRLYTDHTQDCDGLLNKLGIKLFHAEEVHSLPRWVCHIMSLGASSGVSRRQDDLQYKADVEEAEKHYPELAPELRSYAAQSEVILRYISEAGGLGVMCHPYWRQAGRFNVPEALNNVLFERLAFEAVELVTADNVNTSLVNAKYLELARKREPLPVLAGSDWHGQQGERMECACNIIFASECDEKSIVEAIRAGRSVAVSGEISPVVFGDFRLVNYVHFLLRNFYTQRDPLCERLGLLVLCALSGDDSMSDEIARLRAAIDLQNMMLKTQVSI
ncbi:MAG: hypothetical protein IKC77_00950 [Lentisphaeria bacterium]|nr:hypothetical protein [Lentisphaeria bacterium]